jgi:hypothetical protein
MYLLNASMMFWASRGNIKESSFELGIVHSAPASTVTTKSGDRSLEGFGLCLSKVALYARCTERNR